MLRIDIDKKIYNPSYNARSNNSFLLYYLSGVAQGIRCYKCGQYNEGVGSITPCINFTVQMGLKDCPPTSEWCIIFVSHVNLFNTIVTTIKL
ncbi:hypothetical protein HZH68_008968 [Vespula germanica]|uniref:Uncharacterized protein n=1 Tax=Vespula germanica TaxID=30212 RepID=A0A834K099_VESGE|nr:hypothetical protein HZH68_008968 [Vespula germanica]